MSSSNETKTSMKKLHQDVMTPVATAPERRGICLSHGDFISVTKGIPHVDNVSFVFLEAPLSTLWHIPLLSGAVATGVITICHVIIKVGSEPVAGKNSIGYVAGIDRDGDRSVSVY